MAIICDSGTHVVIRLKILHVYVYTITIRKNVYIVVYHGNNYTVIVQLIVI